MESRIACALALAALAGCATPSRQDAFSDVRTLSDRRITWRTSSDEDRQADQQIRQLLLRPIDSDGAVAIALLNNRALQAEYEQLAISQADLVQAGLLRNPIFNASVRFPDRSPHGSDVELSITQSFLDLLLIPSRRQIASADLEATKLRVADDVIDLSSQVRAAFVRVQANEQMLAPRQSAVDSLRLASETAARLHLAGNINDLDLNNHLAMVEQADIDLSAAHRDAASDLEHLRELLGIGVIAGLGEELQISPQLPDLPTADPATRPIARDAIEHRLDAKAARQNINAISQTLGLRQPTQWFSDVEIGVDGERQTDKQWIVGPTFSIPIPLFDHGQASVAKAQGQLRQAQQNYLALVTHIRLQVWLANAKVSFARTRVEQYRTMLSTRQQIVEESQKQYDGSLLGPFDLLKRKQEQLDTQCDAIAALRDYWLARIELDRAMGAKDRSEK